MSDTPFLLPTGSAFYYEFKLVNPDGSPKTGLADVTATISLGKAGAMITGLDQYAVTETLTLGTYVVSFPGGDLRQYVQPLAGRPAFVVVSEGSDVLSSDECLLTSAADAD